VIAVSTRTSPDAEWTPCADFEFSVAQAAIARIERPTFATRALRLEWTGAPELEVAARFASGYQPVDPTIDLEVVREMFLRCWRDWTTSGPVADVALDDVDLGSSLLRTDRVDWEGPSLAMTFAPAGVRITNNSQQALEYEVKGPYSPWGGPYTLPAGGFHQFEVPVSLSYRQRTASGAITFTLPPGSHSIYHARDEHSAPALFLAHERAAEQ
jgi:hypothetical protein